MARLLEFIQKSAWKMAQDIREMMDERNGELPPLEDIVEIFVWGLQSIGKGTGKPMKSTRIWRPIPVVDQMRVLLQGAAGKQVRRSKG